MGRCVITPCKDGKMLIYSFQTEIQVHIIYGVVLLNSIGKSLLHPPTYEGLNTSPPNISKWIFYPLNFLKQDKSPPEAVLKNHSKSQKNHKMQNSIVLDSK
jgi:hypothetical protein